MPDGRGQLQSPHDTSISKEQRAVYLKWRQRIEREDAQSATRKERTFTIDEARQYFRSALLGENGHVISAEELLRELNRPTGPKFTLEEAWRTAADPPSHGSVQQQAYLHRLDQDEAFRQAESREWPRRLIEVASKKDEEAESATIHKNRLLLLRQARVLNDMAACLDSLLISERVGEIAGTDIAQQQILYGNLVMRAIRHNLHEYPVIARFIDGQIITANRRLLRKSRAGLETFVSHPYRTTEEFDCDSEMIRLYLLGHSLAKIRRLILAKGFILTNVTLSRMGMLKRMRRLRREWPWSLSASQGVSKFFTCPWFCFEQRAPMS
ncbi:MAG: hypothetical protein H0W13_08950 [Nitrospirales bacterium]|nr:hypothetical protein [Nitrospirales bacterium]